MTFPLFISFIPSKQKKNTCTFGTKVLNPNTKESNFHTTKPIYFLISPAKFANAHRSDGFCTSPRSFGKVPSAADALLPGGFPKFPTSGGETCPAPGVCYLLPFMQATNWVAGGFFIFQRAAAVPRDSRFESSGDNDVLGLGWFCKVAESLRCFWVFT